MIGPSLLSERRAPDGPGETAPLDTAKLRRLDEPPRWERVPRQQALNGVASLSLAGAGLGVGTERADPESSASTRRGACMYDAATGCGPPRERSMEPRPETFLALLDQTERDALHAIGVRRSFSRGSTLLYQDEPDDRAILLLTGRAKVTRCDEDGRELMLEIRDPGDLVGELACIDGRPRVADVTALERLEALVLPGGAFRSFLETTPQVAAKLLKIIAGRLRETTLSSERYANADTMARLASRILNLADRYGLAEGSAVTIEMPITHEELAAWTGASRAGVAKALQDIRQLGWVETERRRLVLRDLERLRARAA